MKGGERERERERESLSAQYVAKRLHDKCDVFHHELLHEFGNYINAQIDYTAYVILPVEISGRSRVSRCKVTVG